MPNKNAAVTGYAKKARAPKVATLERFMVEIEKDVARAIQDGDLKALLDFRQLQYICVMALTGLNPKGR